MTLDTYAYVLDPADHNEIFREAQALVGATEATRVTDKASYRGNGGRTLMNAPGQGLCAWLGVEYRPGAPLWAEEDARRHDEDCDEDCARERHGVLVPCWLAVSFDTAYGYREENGEGCGGLHARLLLELGGWLDERGLRWCWRNELTGEVWGPGPERYRHLGDLADGGRDAEAWFIEQVLSVLPFLAAETTAGPETPR